MYFGDERKFEGAQHAKDLILTLILLGKDVWIWFVSITIITSFIYRHPSQLHVDLDVANFAIHTSGKKTDVRMASTSARLLKRMYAV
jgi:hypothetical protein